MFSSITATKRSGVPLRPGGAGNNIFFLLTLFLSKVCIVDAFDHNATNHVLYYYCLYIVGLLEDLRSKVCYYT